ncbi:dephospho-CoA kinase [Actinomyces marmotae]|uniref:dephospho-CoA kinase n=1 Tax=Actinomyces marmotae TaxID=2737173 RepID=UPI001F27B9D3|nr:dephospho-CoA kinase [Actinomyces marmotae]
MTRRPDTAIRLWEGQIAASLVGRLRAHGHPFALADPAAPSQPGAILGLPAPGSLPPGTGERALLALIRELAELLARGRAFAAGMGRPAAPRGQRALRVGLTGGIGTGKSTVARLLAEHGAGVVDADAIAREVLAPGGEALAEATTAFGGGILAADGSLNRAVLAGRVFADPAARARLDAITLPRIAELAAYRLEAVPPGRVAVYDVPLLAESGIADLFDCVIVVEAPLEARLARLARRGMDEADALRRIAAQASDARRRCLADIVLPNDRGEQDLADAVTRMWEDRVEPALS